MEVLFASKHIEEKLAKRGITLEDVIDCFGNKEGTFVTETRPQHITNPPTYWFIAEDNRGRLLKVVFVYYSGVAEAHVKTAFEPGPKPIADYQPFKF